MKSTLIRKAAELFDVHPRDIVSHARFGFLTMPRFALYAGLRRRGWNYSQIARLLDRDHKTIIYGVQRAEWMIERSPEYAAKVDAIVALRLEPLNHSEVDDDETALQRDAGEAEADEIGYP